MKPSPARRLISCCVVVALSCLGATGCDGLIADVLATTDRDVDAAIVAYEAGDLDEAARRLKAAMAWRGKRPELMYDQGLVLLAQGDQEGAVAAFERGTESEDLEVRASAFYELGNIALDAEDFEAAISAYQDSLRSLPTHQNAKWNLEIALAMREEQEQEEQDQQDQDEKSEDEKSEDEKSEDEKEPEKEDEKSEDEKSEDEKEPEKEDEKEPEKEDEKEPEKPEGQPEEPDSDSEPQDQPPPEAIEEADIDAALEQLDEQDNFMLGKPSGRQRRVRKDW